MIEILHTKEGEFADCIFTANICRKYRVFLRTHRDVVGIYDNCVTTSFVAVTFSTRQSRSERSLDQGHQLKTRRENTAFSAR